MLRFLVFCNHLVEHALELVDLCVNPVVVSGAWCRLLLVEVLQDLDALLQEFM